MKQISTGLQNSAFLRLETGSWRTQAFCTGLTHETRHIAHCICMACRVLVSRRVRIRSFVQENDKELGKTILVSRIIDNLRSQTTASKTPLLFFYFKHHEETKKSMNGMLRALLVQLLYQDDTLIEYFYQKCCSTSTSQLM